jgi:predicted O-linked N-acetylglucosamine transferase (SPINDLY family)
MVFGLPASLILELSQAYACQKPLKPTGRLRELNGEEFVIAFISADLVDHPTAHLVAAQLMEMRNFATLKVLCVAKPERVSSMNSSSPYRRTIQERCGESFLDVGHLSDKAIANKLTAMNPHVIVHAGFHQDADRVNVLQGGPNAMVVQCLAHLSTTGSSRVDFILGSEITLPEKNKGHFTEKLLRMGAPFHGNSFREFFSHDAVCDQTNRADPASEPRRNHGGRQNRYRRQHPSALLAGERDA